ncbi:DNA-methyltransferase, partial [Klebsiella aerogenes]|uniref:DNA-methyltransferase n=4 Tax=Gammaproteobacteria TaxID=1236 RepID=UPI00379174B8
MNYVLLQGDCLEMMQLLPDNSIDMILCDLPYGTTQNKWDSVIPFDALWHEYKRLCRGAIVLTAAQPFTSAVVMSNLRDFKQALVWEKNVASNFLNANRQHLSRHEDILLFSGARHIFNKQLRKGKPYVAKRYGNDDTGDNYGRITMRTDTVNNGGRNPISVLRFNREVGLHPTQKPIALMEYLIRTYTNPGDKVLDNCMGSGTTGVACAQSGRTFVGIERDPDYFKIAKERVQSAYKQAKEPT